MIVIKHRKSADVVLLRVDAACLDDRDLSGAFLLGAGMAGLGARRAILREANLRNADLRAADLAGADLSGAMLRNADLRDADLSTVVFADADLRGANLSRANLCGANLSRAQLLEADLSDVRCDAQTIWPVGDAWGSMAQPVALVEMSAKSRELAAGRAVVHRWALAQQRTGFSDRRSLSRRGRVAVLGATALAAVLLVAILADRGSDRGARTVSRPTSSPRVAVRAPISTPEKQPDPVPATVPRRGQQPPAVPQLPQAVEIRPAPDRGVQGASQRPVQLARRAAPTRPSSDSNSSGVGGSVRTRAPHRLVVLNSPPARSRRPSVPAPATVVETPLLVESPVVEPVVTPPVVATPVVVPPVAAPPVATAPVAATPARPTSRPEPRPRKMAEAFGNRDFHYGSGYDIYTMHLDRRPR